MGRDKPKKYDKMDYHQKEQYVKNQIKAYGGGAVYHQTDGSRGSANKGMLNLEATKNVLETKMRNDFDYRTSAQHMDGVKGDASIDDFVNYQRGAQKLHRKAGNGGQYSSNEDITTVTNNLVRDANEFMMDKIDALSANEQQAQAETGVAKPASTEMQNARDTVDELGNKDYDVFGANIDNGDNQNQRDQASQAFLGKYKLDLADKKGISPVLPS